MKSHPDTASRSTSAFIPNIQVMRAVAALLVLAVHTPAGFLHAGRDDPHDSWFLQVGVDIFFVISGFIMLHVEDNVGFNNTWHFLKRRCIRIIPLYWIFTTISLIILLHSNRHEVLHSSDFGRFIASYSFWPYANVSSEKGNFLPLLDVGWTLNYEMFFYFIFSLSMFISSRAKRLTFVALILLTFVVLYEMIDLPMPLYFWFDPIILEFVLGMLMALLYSNVKYINLGVIYTTFTLSFAFYIVGLYYREEITDAMGPFSSFWRLLCWGVPSACIVFCAVFSRRIGQQSLSRLLLLLGAASYSIYLSHTFILDALAKSLSESKYLSFSALEPFISLEEICIASLAVVGGIAVYYLVERRIGRFIG